MMRLQPDGSLDPTFSPPPIEREVRSLALLPDGSMLVATNQWDAGGLMHLRQNGSVDPNFRVTITPSEGAFVAAIAALPNGQALIGGRFGFVNGYPAMNLARLNTEVLPPFVGRQLPYNGGTTVRLVVNPPSGTATYAVEDQPPVGWILLNISHGGVFDTVTGRVKFGPFYDAEPRTLTYNFLLPPWGVYGLLGVFTFAGTAAADGQQFPILGDQRLTIAGLMPPDLNPADYAINISEVTAYGAAWRKGEKWPIGPNPISIDYVTRAAALWRWGECYTINGRVAEEPLFWVACPGGSGPTDLPALLAKATFGRRELPASFVPGESLTVSIITEPAAGTVAQAIQEQLPAAWKLLSASEGGEFDAANGILKWGPFYDGASRVLSYQVLPPATSSGKVEFAGAGSSNGSSAPTVGASAISEGCRLEWASDSEPGKVAMVLSGRIGARFQVEASRDLRVWTVLTVLTNSAGRVEFSDPDGMNQTQCFYRARLVE
jgi:hypothetical protein